MNNKTAAIGALFCAASVALGAFGAHMIADLVTAERLSTWHTATRYLGTQGLGILILSLFGQINLRRSVYLIIAGTLLFSSALILIVATNIGWFGAIAPIGGLLMISGWLLAALKLYRFGSFEKSK